MESYIWPQGIMAGICSRSACKFLLLSPGLALCGSTFELDVAKASSKARANGKHCMPAVAVSKGKSKQELSDCVIVLHHYPAEAVGCLLQCQRHGAADWLVCCRLSPTMDPGALWLCYELGPELCELTLQKHLSPCLPAAHLLPCPWQL